MSSLELTEAVGALGMEMPTDSLEIATDYQGIFMFDEILTRGGLADVDSDDEEDARKDTVVKLKPALNQQVKGDWADYLRRKRVDKLVETPANNDGEATS